MTVGPLEIGLLPHHPERRGAIGSDHYVIALGVEGQLVRVHDPHGYPYATLPIEAFTTAWRADSIPYAEVAYRMWSNFRQLRRVDPLEALRACLPDAAAWLERGRPERVPPGSLGCADAAYALAEMVDEGLRPTSGAA